MKSLIFLVFCSLSQNYISQTITQDVISTDGGYYENGSASLQFNVGEIVTETLISSDGISFLQGFEQSDYSILSVNENDGVFDLAVVYPNPTKSIVYIDFTNFGEYEIKVMDISGKLLKTILSSNSTSIDLSIFSTGVYMIQLFNKKDNQSKIFKISKYE